MGYEAPKTKDYGVDTCEGCFAKQREIDRLKEEVQQLRLKVCANQRKRQAGFFGSSTPRDKLVRALNKLSQDKNLEVAEELFGSPKS